MSFLILIIKINKHRSDFSKLEFKICLLLSQRNPIEIEIGWQSIYQWLDCLSIIIHIKN